MVGKIVENSASGTSKKNPKKKFRFHQKKEKIKKWEKKFHQHRCASSMKFYAISFLLGKNFNKSSENFFSLWRGWKEMWKFVFSCLGGWVGVVGGWLDYQHHTTTRHVHKKEVKGKEMVRSLESEARRMCQFSHPLLPNLPLCIGARVLRPCTKWIEKALERIFLCEFFLLFHPTRGKKCEKLKEKSQHT